MANHYTEEPLTFESATSPTDEPSPSQAPPRRRMSAHAQADADRALRHTFSWKPAFERRQSWNKEDQKHDLHKASIDGVKTGPGFTEQ